MFIKSVEHISAIVLSSFSNALIISQKRPILTAVPRQLLGRIFRNFFLSRDRVTPKSPPYGYQKKNIFLTKLVSVPLLWLVGVCVGDFFTKNTLKLYIGQSSLKNDFFAKIFFFIVINVKSSIALRKINLIWPRGGARERVENFSKIFLERHQVNKISTYAYILK